jgi:hypothetical protein
MTIMPIRRADPSADASQRVLADPQALHRRLSHWNHHRLAPCAPTADWRAELAEEQTMRLQEGAWVESLRAEVADRAAEAPTDVDGFVAWFEALEENGPGQHDPLFDFLAEEATREEMCWFLTQEAAGEAGFDDLVAYTQVKLPPLAKLEHARNYWDEMGRGNHGGMHGVLLEQTTADLRLRPAIDETVWQALALANTMTALATTRRYAWHSVGALGVVELTAPGRVALVAKGLKRLGVEPRTRKYFDLHAVLDVKHSADWNEEALKPLMRENASLGRWLAEGALMRLECGRRCFEAYRGALMPALRVVARG